MFVIAIPSPKLVRSMIVSAFRCDRVQPCGQEHLELIPDPRRRTEGESSLLQKNMRKTFKRLGELKSRSCPWCARPPVRFYAKKKAVLFSCGAQKPCGYRAWIPKGQLTYEERKMIYGGVGRARFNSY